jgi:hypothetical protein
MAYVNYKVLIHSWLTPALEKWFREQACDPYKAFYFYYKESTADNHGALAIAAEPLNDDWKLVSAERVSGFKTIPQLQYQLGEMCWNLPILKP